MFTEPSQARHPTAEAGNYQKGLPQRPDSLGLGGAGRGKVGSFCNQVGGAVPLGDRCRTSKVLPAEAHERQLNEKGTYKSPFEGGLRGMFSGDHTPLPSLDGGITLRKLWHALELTRMRSGGNPGFLRLIGPPPARG
jgi:hypothetical protein